MSLKLHLLILISIISLMGKQTLFSSDLIDLHTLTINSSFESPSFADHLITPFNTHGLGNGGEIKYNYTREHISLDLSLKGAKSDLSSGNTNPEEDDDFNTAISTYFILNYIYSVPELKLNILTGLRTDYMISYFSINHISTKQWVGDLSLFPSLILEYPIKNSCIRISGAFSIFSLVNRPVWTIYDSEIDQLVTESQLLILFRGEPVTVDRYIRVISDIELESTLSPKLKLTTGFSLEYIRTNIPWDAKFISSSLYFGVKYVF